MRPAGAFRDALDSKAVGHEKNRRLCLRPQIVPCSRTASLGFVEPAVLRPRLAPGDRSNIISIAPPRFALNGFSTKGPHVLLVFILQMADFGKNSTLERSQSDFSEQWRARRDSNSRPSDSKFERSRRRKPTQSDKARNPQANQLSSTPSPRHKSARWW